MIWTVRKCTEVLRQATTLVNHENKLLREQTVSPIENSSVYFPFTIVTVIHERNLPSAASRLGYKQFSPYHQLIHLLVMSMTKEY